MIDGSIEAADIPTPELKLVQEPLADGTIWIGLCWSYAVRVGSGGRVFNFSARTGALIAMHPGPRDPREN